jgi:hypothetical protein
MLGLRVVENVPGGHTADTADLQALSGTNFHVVQISQFDRRMPTPRGG